ncbi:TVP38/TMEM64 family protein [Chryseomicrobium aureum]|uniref:TVP38/TMEM64 family protein n=1 Tax=Chryseomicrobium aureum TaxID=1441723 RepID=UPI001959BBF9|nr:VTT domain-containing protein [Chryseomicrobium aureum]MBM7705926.1 putative membrane protein YdjX (TVP38/TMEM64 family) [Chryseomicrobium aureum]
MKKWMIVLPIALLISCLLVIHFDLFRYLYERDIDRAQAYLTRNWASTLLLTFLIMLIQHTFTIFPLLLVISMNVLIYGLLPGFLWSWFASLLASAIVFYAVRYLVDDLVVRKIPKSITRSIEANSFLYVFQARIIPFIPTSLVNLAAGLSHVKFMPFILATAIGNFIFFFLLALVSEGLLEATTEQFSLFGIAFAALLIYLVLMWRKRKWKKPKVKTEENPPHL